MPDIKILWELERSFQQQHPDGFTVMTMIRQEQATTKPADDVLREAAAMSREFDPVVRMSALVIEARGLMGSVTRTVIAGVNMMARSKNPMRVFATVEMAMEAIVRAPGQDASLQQDMPQIVAALRQDVWRVAV